MRTMSRERNQAAVAAFWKIYENAVMAMDGDYPIDSPEVSLERLEASIQEALDRLIDGGRIDNGHRERAAEFRRRLEALQKRLRASRNITGLVEMPADTKSDFDLLAWDFKRWLAEIDQHFEIRASERLGQS